MSPAELPDLKKFESRPVRELITDPARLQRMLQSLWERRNLLSAQFEGDPNPYNTALLDVDADRGFLLLDELAPRKGHDAVRVGTRLRVMGVLGGVPTRFHVEVQDILVQGGIAFYRAPMPKQLEYQQRRAFFRAYVPRSLELRVLIVKDDQTELSGRLLDLSLGGFGMLLPQNAPVDSLEVVAVRSLALPERQTIACRAEIRYTQQEYGQKLIRVGARFVELEGVAERTLLRAILHLEREQIRKKPPPGTPSARPPRLS